MSTTTPTLEDYTATAPPAGNGNVAAVAAEPVVEKGQGWLLFATVMLVFGGIMGVIDGIVALSKSTFYVAGARFVFSDLHTWGWIILVVGALTALAGLTVMTGSELARWFGITIAGLQGLAQLGMIQAYPFWSLVIFAVDVLVIYALAVYGGSRLRGQV